MGWCVWGNNDREQQRLWYRVSGRGATRKRLILSIFFIHVAQDDAVHVVVLHPLDDVDLEAAADGDVEGLHHLQWLVVLQPLVDLPLFCYDGSCR